MNLCSPMNISTFVVGGLIKYSLQHQRPKYFKNGRAIWTYTYNKIKNVQFIWSESLHRFNLLLWTSHLSILQGKVSPCSFLAAPPGLSGKGSFLSTSSRDDSIIFSKYENGLSINRPLKRFHQKLGTDFVSFDILQLCPWHNSPQPHHFGGGGHATPCSLKLASC